MKKGYQHNYLRPNRYNILGPKFERSNRDRTKLDRDVADIRCACAVRDLGNGGFQRYCGRCTRPRRPRTSPRPGAQPLTTGVVSTSTVDNIKLCISSVS